MRRSLPVLAAVVLLSAVAGPFHARDASYDPDRPRDITIAVVRDGPMPDDPIPGMVEDQLRPLLDPEVTVTWKHDPAFDAGWDPARAAGSLQAALDDPEVDIVFAVGAMTTVAAARAELNKPVVSSFVQAADVVNLLSAEGDRSAKEGLSFVLVPLAAELSLTEVKRLFRVDTIHLFLQAEYIGAISGLEQAVAGLEAAVGVRIPLVPVEIGGDGEVVLPEGDLQAVLVADAPALSDARRATMYSRLAERGVPTYTLRGRQDIALGALATRTPDIRLFVARRLALNLSEIIRGTPVENLPVILFADPQLVLNGTVAAEIGYSPDLQTLNFADIENLAALQPPGEPMSLARAMDMAGTNSRTVAIAEQDVESSFRQSKLAGGRLLPQVGLRPRYVAENVPGLTGDIIPGQTGRIGVGFEQMIYDDRAVSDSKSAKRAWEGSQEARDSERLDAYAQAGLAYYDVVLNEVLYRITVDNLRLTEENLELAKLRRRVGYSGRDEVARWESEVAQRKGDLFLREADIEAARIRFNQILAIDQTRRWRMEEREVDPDSFPWLDGRLTDRFSDYASVRRTFEALVRVAKENSPELRTVQKGIEAQDIQVSQRKRRWWLPKFSFEGTYDYEFWRESGFEDLERDVWRVAVLGTYPVYIGGARKQDIRLETSERARLDHERALASDLVERRTRTVLQRISASFPNVRFARLAADAARDYLEVVQDKYGQGLIDVTTLLEAQNTLFTTQQAAVGANYVFLSDLVELERALSWFEELSGPEERDALVDRIESELEQGETR